MQDDVLVLKERDAPESAGRCDCLCVYDFRASAEGVAPGTWTVRIEREVTDNGDPETVFERTIDLVNGFGIVVVDQASAEPWCEAP